MSSQDSAAEPANNTEIREQALSMIARSLRGLRFGQVTIIVQDGRVVQVDRTERQRINSSESTG